MATFVYGLLKHSDIIHRLTPAHSGWFYAFALLALAVGTKYEHWHGMLVFELLILLVVFGFYAQSIMTEALCRSVIKAVAYGSIFAAVGALVQKYPDILFRSQSFFYNANYYAYTCEIVTVVLIYALFRYGFDKLLVAAACANIVGILCSGCRTAWLALLFGGIILMICLKKYLPLLVTLGIAALYGISALILPGALFPRFNAFVNDKMLRFLIWKTAMGYIKEHPLFGQGMFTYFTRSVGRAHDTHAHNLYLDMLVNFGIIGTAIATVFLIITCAKLIKRLRVNPACAIPLGILAATLVHGFTDVPFVGLQSGAIFILMFSLAGVWGKYRADNPIEALENA